MKREDMCTPVAFGRYVPSCWQNGRRSFSAATARELRDHDLAVFMSGGIAKFDETTEESVGAALTR